MWDLASEAEHDRDAKREVEMRRKGDGDGRVTSLSCAETIGG